MIDEKKKVAFSASEPEVVRYDWQLDQPDTPDSRSTKAEEDFDRRPESDVLDASHTSSSSAERPTLKRKSSRPLLGQETWWTILKQAGSRVSKYRVPSFGFGA